MRYCVEKPLKYFEFWSGAWKTAEALTDEDFEILEVILNDISTEVVWSETDINDLFWFDTDLIAEWLGYENWDELCEKRGGD